MNVRVEIRSVRPGQVTLKCTDGSYSTEYTCSSQLEVGRVLTHAVENFFYQRARHQADKWFEERR